ncbi:MAG: DNA polymerase I [Candidatus Omnitrophica bacterium]|nr:DNA polymerase I [Candidatus Omnitrophota bacterium]
MRRKKLYLIDGNSYSYRAFYAIADLTNSSGKPTGAVFGFVNMLNKLRKEGKPDYLAICFDLKGPTLRHEKFHAYKAHRKPMPDDLQTQMPIIKEVVGAYGIPVFQLAGYEADDIIATLAVSFKDKVDVFIVSGDKDMLQLVDKYVSIYNPQKEDAITDEKKVFERYGVTPSQITDLLALAGDSADNIPGVPGIGPKTAAELIGAFGSLESVLKNTCNIQQKKRKQLLEEFAEQARMSKELATIIYDVPIKADLQRLEGAGEDTERLKNIFLELEFKSLYRNLLKDVPKENSDLKVEIIETAFDLESFSKKLCKEKEFSLVLQESDNKTSNTLKSLEISFNKKDFVRIHLSQKLTIDDLKKFLEPVFKRSDILKIGYDLKASCVMLDACGIYLEVPFFDIMVGAYLLEPGGGKSTISDIAGFYLGRNVDLRFQVCEQISLRDILLKELESKKVRELFCRVEMPLIRILASMQRNGIRIDEKYLLRLGDEVDKKLNTLTSNIFSLSGCEFNINSPKQLSEILFERLKLPIIKKGKSGPSTNVDVLTQLAEKHDLPAMILQYREQAKLKSTYIDGLLELVNTKTHKIHTTFNQTVTATGRLSSSNPNLQNIPVRTDAGRQIRAAFVSEAESWKLLCADYSQIELRVLAHLSGDSILIKAFKENLDIHNFTASLVFGVAQDSVTEKMRNMAKRVNFGIIYGMGPYALARDIGVSHSEAKKFIDEYFKRYPKVTDYLNGEIKKTQDRGYVTTLLNRRRYIPQINAKDAMQRSFSERTAMNTPIQGSAADLIKAAMVAIYRQLKKEGLKAKMLLQVHDELVFDVPDKEMIEVKKIVKDKMENVLKLDVPIQVSFKIGKNWRDIK